MLRQKNNKYPKVNIYKKDDYLTYWTNDHRCYANGSLKASMYTDCENGLPIGCRISGINKIKNIEKDCITLGDIAMYNLDDADDREKQILLEIEEKLGEVVVWKNIK